jgi:hypothetical protein
VKIKLDKILHSYRKNRKIENNTFDLQTRVTYPLLNVSSILNSSEVMNLSSIKDIDYYPAEGRPWVMHTSTLKSIQIH